MPNARALLRSRLARGEAIAIEELPFRERRSAGLGQPPMSISGHKLLGSFPNQFRELCMLCEILLYPIGCMYGRLMLTWLGYIYGQCYHIWHTRIRHGNDVFIQLLVGLWKLVVPQRTFSRCFANLYGLHPIPRKTTSDGYQAKKDLSILGCTSHES